jgi:hypothetical protein
MVDLDSKLNSFLVNLDNKFDFPTPESPINTTIYRHEREVETEVEGIDEIQDKKHTFE